jgi:hypothetical protein
VEETAMNSLLVIFITVLGTAGSSMPLPAGSVGLQASPSTPPRVEVCKLVPKEEVKKHLPWMDVFDRMPLVEEPIGTSGSSCEFPTVGVQVLAFSQGFVDAARKSAPLEPVSGVGDEAYFRNNQNRYAELLVRVGPRLLTLQASAEGKMDAVKPRVIELAKVYVAKLR